MSAGLDPRIVADLEAMTPDEVVERVESLRRSGAYRLADEIEAWLGVSEVHDG